MSDGIDARTPKASRNPKQVGVASEALVMAKLVSHGFAVSIPFGDNQRYDLVVDDGVDLRRVQVKTGRLVNGDVEFAACSVDARTSERRGYQGEADDFLVYCQQTDEVYRVLVADCAGMARVTLSIDEQRALRRRNAVRWAHEHVFVDTAKTGPLKACSTLHPDSPCRLAMKSAGDSKRVYYCRECNRVSNRRRVTAKAA